MQNNEPSVSADVYPLRLVVGIVVAVCVYELAGCLPFKPGVSTYSAQMAAAITAFVATCWLWRAMHLAAASLAPLALMPMLGVLPIKQCAVCYAHPIIWMFFGGFVLALGVERWGLHKRIALVIIGLMGVKPSQLVLGFMVSAAFLSMWLNNTSTTLLLLPVATALVKTLASAGAIDAEHEANFSFALLLGIAYACSIGGMGTPIGTAPNALFFSQYAKFESMGGPAVDFAQWVLVGVPLVVIMVPLVWLLLTRVMAPLPGECKEAKAILAEQAAECGKMDSAQSRMLAIFALAAVLWITRRDFDVGALGCVPGWWRLLPVSNADVIGDGAVAVFVAVLSFIVPSGRERGVALMNWPTARKLPWEILLLIGGGIAIAEAFSATGLAWAVGQSLLAAAQQVPPLVLLMLVCALMTLLTEVTSNTATTALLLPILASMATAAGIDPRLLMIGATLSASCAFMLPIATPPNAIVFSSGYIPMARMAKAGVALNLIGVVVISAVVWFVAAPIMDIETHGAPQWLQEADVDRAP